MIESNFFKLFTSYSFTLKLIPSRREHFASYLESKYLINKITDRNKFFLDYLYYDSLIEDIVSFASPKKFMYSQDFLVIHLIEKHDNKLLFSKNHNLRILKQGNLLYFDYDNF